MSKSCYSLVMQTTICFSCQKPKAILECGVCKNSICKSCFQEADEEAFSFLEKVPPELEHTIYCMPCYNQIVEPALADYAETMEKAKEVFVFLREQSKETRLFRRLHKPLKVTDCADPKETQLRLAFKAVQAGFNTLVDVELNFDKTRDGSYQLIKWRGVGIPVHGDAEKLNRKILESK